MVHSSRFDHVEVCGEGHRAVARRLVAHGDGDGRGVARGGEGGLVSKPGGQAADAAGPADGLRRVIRQGRAQRDYHLLADADGRPGPIAWGRGHALDGELVSLAGGKPLVLLGGHVRRNRHLGMKREPNW